jgi:cytochrome c peroxidase
MSRIRSSSRTMLITCTTALIVALLSLHLMPPSAHAGRASTGPKRLRPKDEALIELGRRLFFEPLVSRSGDRSCASCHDPEHGFSDAGRVSEDDFGRTRRHSQTLLDTARNPSAHWDGEFENVAELVLARVGALKGRKGKLGHGATLVDIVSAAAEEDASGPLAGDDGTGDGLTEEDPADGEQEEVLGDGDDPVGGGEGGGGYGEGGGDRETRAPSSAKAREAGADGKSSGAAAAPAAQKAAGMAAKKSPAKAAPKKAAPKKADAKKDKADAADARAVRRTPTAEELKARAEALRAELRRLPLAEEVLETGGRYAEAFEAAFGSPTVSSARMARAIAAYCDSLESTPAAYDRYAAGASEALSASAQRGLALFRGRAQCVSCHAMEGPHPAFTDFAFHNTGVVWDRLPATERRRLLSDDELFRRKKDDLETPKKIDGGRARISTRKRDLRSFKTPTLRDVARRGPYMHDGRFATLEEVVRYYAKGGGRDPAGSPHVAAFKASAEDVADLVAFLEALTGTQRPGLPARLWRARTEETRLRFVDAGGKALAGLPVTLTPAGDWALSKPGPEPRPLTRTTDAKGWIHFPPSAFIQTRVTLPDGLRPARGDLVPDTCHKATILVPVRGKVSLVARLPATGVAPTTLVAEHQGTFVLPGHDTPRTLFTRTHVLASGHSQVARYEGWLRTDVPNVVVLRLPGRKKGAAAPHVTLDAKTTVRLDLTGP